MRRGNVIGRVCLSVMFTVFRLLTCAKCQPTNFIFGMQVLSTGDAVALLKLKLKLDSTQGITYASP